MQRSDWLPRTSWTFTVVLWLAAGPLMLPLIGAIRCRHAHGMTTEQMAHMPRPASNPAAPCYCDQMTAGLDGGLLLTPAVPTMLPSVVTPVVIRLAAVPPPFPRPTSRVPTPTPPPPIELV